MKKTINTILTGLYLMSFLGLSQAAIKPTDTTQKYYGKITAVDMAAKNIVVHNSKRNQDLSFVWDSSTQLTFKKDPIHAEDLKVGQFLMVAYESVNNVNQAKKIAVRPTPFKKNKTDNAE